MTDSAMPTDQTPDIAAAVQALKPQLRQSSIIALIFILISGTGGAIGVAWALNVIESGDTGIKIAVVAGVLGLGGILASLNRMHRKQESLVMPIVAGAVGLVYTKDATAFRESLPDRLLPGQARRSAEDLVYGQLGNHTIHMAEVKVETGGKNSRTLFKGVVARIPNSIAMPAFFLAPKEQTRPGMIFSAWIPTDGLSHLRDVTGAAGRVYGLWASSADREEPPALSAVVDILTSLENRLNVPMSLFTATSDGTQMHLALEHKRDLFRVGGFFQDDARLFRDVHAATRDLSVPLNLVRELVSAEVAAAGKIKQA